MLLLLGETLIDSSWPSSRHVSLAAKFSRRLPPAWFPASPMASGSAGETSGGLAYVRMDFVEDMPSLLSLFLELSSRVSAVDHHQAGIAVIALE